MDDINQKQFEGLFALFLQCNSRLTAFELTLGEILKMNPQQKEAFHQILEKNFKISYQVAIENVEKYDPALAARLIDGQNPYTGLV